MLLVGFGPISVELYLPALSQVAHTFNTPVVSAQLTIALYPIGYGLSQLFLGPLSDRFGRKKILLSAGFLYLLMTIVCFFSNSITGLVIARIFQAVGACSGPLMARAMIRDLYDTQTSAKMLGTVASVMGFVPALSPILGGYLTDWFGWRSNFVFMFGFAIMALVLMQFVFHETNTHLRSDATKIKSIFSGYIRVYSDKYFIVYCSSMCLFYGGLFALITQAPLLFHDFLHATPKQFGRYFFPIIISYAIGSYVVSRYMHNFSISQKSYLAIFIGLFSGIALMVVNGFLSVNVFTLLAPLCLYSFSAGIMLPSGIAGAMHNMYKQAGSASGALGFTQMVFASSIASLVSLLYMHHLIAIYLTLLLTSCSALLILIFARYKQYVEKSL